ncbi:GATA transcription factor 3-like [Elaeis guineensis]|uniref:GATA transcription factor 7-like n=1 Tax=Elaeis guineensis var. tenera TaxID=51953 RepID=A0A6I9RRN2_ELAGV|nr:GATA transcription factor 7-like [Elaeis guineensis]
MTLSHRVFQSLYLDESLEPDTEDPAEEELAVPNDPLDELDWQTPLFGDVTNMLRSLPTPKRTQNNDVLDLRREICTKRVPRKPRRQCSGRRIWSLEPPTLSCSGARENSRSCIHCLATDTPQWRAGPAGPGTLCNACGIRFKSGRLLPQYRPSTSPTFKGRLHSNRHKKVMKIREQSGDADIADLDV